MLEKIAPAAHPIQDVLARRWSPRAFSSQDVEAEKLRSVFEAARWAPSCFNEQPWSYLVATRRETEHWERLVSCLVEGNRTWAERAPVIFLNVASNQFSRNGKPNRWGQHDLGLYRTRFLGHKFKLRHLA